MYSQSFVPNIRRVLLLACLVAATQCTPQVDAQDDPQAGLIAPGSQSPLLRIQANGPLGRVTSLAFSPDGDFLYAGSWDKVVHVWALDDGRFRYQRQSVFRVPVGGGLDGGISTISVSSDGQWLAIGGRGAKRRVAGVREHGYVWPAGSMSDDMREDEGLIYVFNTRTREVRILRGHKGAVLSLSFAPAHPGKPPVLASVADVAVTEGTGGFGGEIVVWNVQTGGRVGTLRRVPVQADDGDVAWRALPHANPGFDPVCRLWHTGDDVDALRAVVLWGDLSGAVADRMGARIWDVASGRVTMRDDDDAGLYVDATVTDDRGLRALLIGATGDSGQTVDLSLGAGSLKNVKRSRDARTAQQFARTRVPVAIASLGSDTGRYATLVADFGQSTVRLELASQNDGRLTPNGSADLFRWQGPLLPPSLAASSRGHIAVTHEAAGEILVYQQDQVRAGDASAQHLHASGTRLSTVQFARNGEKRGFLLRTSAEADRQDRSLVVDVTDGAVSSDVAGWTGESIDAKGLQTVVSERDGLPVIRVTGGGENRPITLQCEVPDDVPALRKAIALPAGEHYSRPLVLVAWNCGRKPRLDVFNAATGERIRQFTGHVSPIRDLAISADGRLAASVAEDHTLRVWNLKNLGEHIGRHGLLRDGNQSLSVRDKGDRVEVAAEFGNLQVSEAIKSITIGDEKIEVESAWKFYESIHRRRPGTAVTLGIGTRSVDLSVGQAIDERKPLFSAFLIEDDDGESWSWIGWNPLGPYDAGGASAEQNLGWHFNTGDPVEPTRFALAEEYRDAFRTPGLLKHLMQRAALPDPEPVEPPEMSLLILDADGQALVPEFDGNYFTQTSSATARVKVGTEFPSALIERVQWRLERPGEQRADVPFVDAEFLTQHDFELDLSQADWSRGVYELRARLTTSELPSRTFDATAPIRFQPLPPDIRLREPLPKVTSEKQVVLKLTVNTPGGPAAVRIRHTNAQAERLTSEEFKDVVGPRDLDVPLTLGPGYNRLVIMGANNGRLYGFEDRESLRLVRETTFTPPAAAEPPAIQLTKIVAGDRELAAESGEPLLTVTRRRIRLIGRVKASDKLGSIVLKLGDQEISPDGFKPRTGDEFEISEELELELLPGEQTQTITVSAETENGGTADSKLELRYQPPVPTVSGLIVSAVMLDERAAAVHAEDEDLVRSIAGIHAEVVRIRADLAEDADPRKFDVALLVDGKPVESPQVEVSDDQLTATLSVAPGRHNVQLKLSNEWNHQWTSPAHPVVRIVPPSAKFVDAPTEASDAQLDRLVLQVQSPEELPVSKDDVTVRVNDSVVVSPEQLSVERDGSGWSVVVSDLRFPNEGTNTVTASIRNTDDEASVTTVSHSIKVPETQSEPPVVEFLAPGETVAERDQQVRFRVTSDEPLANVLLQINGDAIPVVRIDEEPNADGEPGVALFEADVRLQPGHRNRLVATATPDSGPPGQAFQHISVAEWPAALRIESLGRLKPRQRLDGVFFDDSVPTPRAELSGTVYGQVYRGRAQRTVKIWVNGFMQASARLIPAGNDGRRFTFRTNLTFNRAEANQVEFELPNGTRQVDAGVQKNGESRPQFLVDCSAPEREQELHILIFAARADGIPEKTPDQLSSRAMRALGASQGRRAGESQSPAFARIHKPRILTGDRATRTQLLGQLDDLHKTLRENVRTVGTGRAPHAVVMIYYYGREIVRNPTEFVLVTNDPRPSSYIKSGDLSRNLRDMFGAHLLLLDVESDSDAVRWPVDPYLGVFRTAWKADMPPTSDAQPLISALETVINGSRLAGDLRNGLESRLRQDEAVFPDLTIPERLTNLQIGASDAGG